MVCPISLTSWSMLSSAICAHQWKQSDPLSDLELDKLYITYITFWKFYRFSMWAQTFGLYCMSYNKLDVCSVGTDRVWKFQNQMLCTIMSYKVPHLWCNKICKHIYCLTQLTVTTWNIHSFTLNSSSANHISALLQTTDYFAHSCSIFETCVANDLSSQNWKENRKFNVECLVFHL